MANHKKYAELGINMSYKERCPYASDPKLGWFYSGYTGTHKIKNEHDTWYKSVERGASNPFQAWYYDEGYSLDFVILKVVKHT